MNIYQHMTKKEYKYMVRLFDQIYTILVSLFSLHCSFGCLSKVIEHKLTKASQTTIEIQPKIVVWHDIFVF